MSVNSGRFENKWTQRQLAQALQQIAMDEGPNYQRASDVPYLSLLTRAKADVRFKLLLDAAIETRRRRQGQAKRDGRRRDALAIIDLVRTGTAIKVACEAVGTMSCTTFFKVVKRDDELRTLLDEASSVLRRLLDSERWRFFSPEQIDDVATLIRAGFTLDAAFAKVAPDSPTSQRVHFLKREAWAREAVDDAIRYRESTDRATGRKAHADRSQWQEADYNAALSAIAFSQGKAIRSVLVPPLMSYIAVYHRAQRDPQFAERLSSAVGDYRTARRLKHAKAKQRRAAPPKPASGAEMLKSALLMDDLYREVSALFHRGLPDRDEMISDVIMAVYSGDLAREDIGRRGLKIGKACLNQLTDKRMDTLDRPISRDGGGSNLIEFISSSDWTSEAFA